MSEKSNQEINSALVEKIPQTKFIPLKIKGIDGKIMDFSAKEVKELIKKFVFGGKTASQLDKYLIKNGVCGDAWEKRERIMKLFTDLHDDKISAEDREELGREIAASKIEEHENI